MSLDVIGKVTGRSAVQLAALLQSGALDAEQLTEAVLAAITACDDKAIFTTVTAERAMAEARAAGKRLRAGRPASPLDGVPVAWKDLFDIEGLVTTAGSQVLASDPPAARDAAVVTRLREAGMICVGRVNMSEFAFSGLGLNPHYGTPHNPHGRDEPRVPGGSSSGSGVVVARGLVPVSIGTDTGGSVRIPAAYNGVIGYKATRGRYSMDGVYPLASSLDSLGPLCRTVADAVLVDAAMRGLPASAVRRGRLEGQRLVVPGNVVFDDAEPAVVAAFEAALDRLVAQGVTVERRVLPAFGAIFDLIRKHGALVTAEAYALHRERLENPATAAQIDPRVVSRTRLGAGISMPDYVAIMQTRTRLIAEMEATIEPGTLIAYPTLPWGAPPIEPLRKDDDLFVRTNVGTLRNTLIGNFLDWCGVTIPCGTNSAGLPIGFLLSGLTGRDEALLSAALAAEPIIRGDLS
jgi:aspartyl-tRNA(Asn)/glutamyl-tRNA(Gln) amidotransferase subunit A